MDSKLYLRQESGIIFWRDRSELKGLHGSHCREMMQDMTPSSPLRVGWQDCSRSFLVLRYPVRLHDCEFFVQNYEYRPDEWANPPGLIDQMRIDQRAHEAQA